MTEGTDRGSDAVCLQAKKSSEKICFPRQAKDPGGSCPSASKRQHEIVKQTEKKDSAWLSYSAIETFKRKNSAPKMPQEIPASAFSWASNCSRPCAGTTGPWPLLSHCISWESCTCYQFTSIYYMWTHLTPWKRLNTQRDGVQYMMHPCIWLHIFVFHLAPERISSAKGKLLNMPLLLVTLGCWPKPQQQKNNGIERLKQLDLTT